MDPAALSPTVGPGAQGRKSSYDSIAIGVSVRLGSAGLLLVYDGCLADGSRVAVKKLEVGKHLWLKDFQAEVAAISSIHHSNLVHLRGFCFEGVQRFLVYEYVAKGSLNKWLFSPREGAKEFKTDGFVLDWNTPFKIALGTTRGLGYLHKESPSRIIHSNIKPQNILLDEQFCPTIRFTRKKSYHPLHWSWPPPPSLARISV